MMTVVISARRSDVRGFQEKHTKRKLGRKMQVDAYASQGTAYTQLTQVHKAVAANPARIDRQHLIGSDPSETLRVGIAAFASSSFLREEGKLELDTLQ